MAAKRRTSLVDFAARETLRPGKLCWLCSIPERDEVEQAVLSGQATKASVVRWLKAPAPDGCGYGDQANPNRIDNHFRAHVNG